MKTQGIWVIYDDSDIAPPDLFSTAARSNLCTICGVRVWRSDMYLHEIWHENMGG